MQLTIENVLDIYMNEKDHLNRTILKLNSFKNKSDEPADSVDITFTTKNNKIDKADGDKLNEELHLTSRIMTTFNL